MTHHATPHEAPPNLFPPQRILVFQQHGSAESKIQGIRRFGDGRFALEVLSIDLALPPIIDDAREFLPPGLETELRGVGLVLDYLRHPDLSQDLSLLCAKAGVPVVASGKKLRVKGTSTPPT